MPVQGIVDEVANLMLIISNAPRRLLSRWLRAHCCWPPSRHFWHHIATCQYIHAAVLAAAQRTAQPSIANFFTRQTIV